MPNTWLGRDSNGILRDFTSSEVSDTTAPYNVQRLRLLGPYRVTYQTANIRTTGVQLTTLEAGQLLVSAWVVNSQTWTPSSATVVTHTIFVGGTPAAQSAGQAWSDGYYVEVSRSQAEFAPGLGITPEPVYNACPVFVNAVTTPDTLQASSAFIRGPSVLGILVESAQTLTGGIGDVYALIAEPIT